MCGYDSFASSVVINQCSSPLKKFSSNMHYTNMTGNYLQHELDCNNNNNRSEQLCDQKVGESGNNKIGEPIYDDIKQNYEYIENVRVPERCSTIIEEFYGEV